VTVAADRASFACPNCESAIIFSSRSKILFQLGVVLALFVGLPLFGIRPKKSPAQVVEGPEGRKIGLHVLSDFGDTHTFVAEVPKRRIIVSTIRTLDWETGFHQIILVKEPGVSLEVGGSLNPDDGLSAVYTDEKRNVCEVTSSPPETIEDMVALLVSFLTGGGRWEQMYDFR
jgi:hypothetical protein